MEATFIIVREDLQLDPATIVSEGVLLGRLPTCELLLNHPSVSRLHAGISYNDGDYYIRTLRQSNPVVLNGDELADYHGIVADCGNGKRGRSATRSLRSLPIADDQRP
jgi:hypothetical protein